MATYTYTALDKTDSYVKGKIEAYSLKRATLKLEQEGFLVINLKSEKIRRFGNIKNLFITISRLDKIFFTRHLHTLLESGISLDQALKIIAEQTNNPKFKEVILDLYRRTQKGQALHEALTEHNKCFSNFYINLIRVGEKSGTLDTTLEYLLEQQEKDYELITKVRGAMIYPSVIVTAMILILTFMMTFVVPQITAILLEYNVQPPLPTRILIAISNFLVNYLLFLPFIFILIVYLFNRLLKTPRGKWYWDALLLNIPKFRQIIIEFNLARLARSLCTLLKTGVPIDQALRLTANVSHNSHYQKSMQSAIQFVIKGIPLTEVLHGQPQLYPPLATRMLEIGEKTGKADEMLTRLAIFYEKSVTNTLQNLSSIIEPLLLLCVGLMVGFVAVSVLTPIWKLTETI